MKKKDHLFRDKPASKSEIEAGALVVRIVFGGLMFSLDFNFPELEEIVKRAMRKIEEIELESKKKTNKIGDR